MPGFLEGLVEYVSMTPEAVKYLCTFLVSMLPVVEIRGGVPVGVALGLPLLPTIFTCVLGNMLPVPFIVFFIKRIFAWMRSKSKKLAALVDKMENRAFAKSGTIKKYEALGLFIFVAIPLPGTGAWTGALIGTLLDLRRKYMFPSILAGIFCAGIIMSILSYGVAALFAF